ncbi:MAG: DUF6089 family protein [Chitinophagaceae bacterium]
MNVLTRCLFILFSQLNMFQAFPQYAFYNEHYVEGKFTGEFMAEGGAMNCLTDLGGNQGSGKRFIKDVNIKQSRLCYGISGAINYNRIISLRLQMTKGKVSADDQAIKNAGSAARGRYLRNLNFESTIRELSAVLEIYPLMFFVTEGKWLPSLDWYIFAGLGCFYFNPVARLGDSRIELADLRTEGQGFDEYPEKRVYRRNQFNLPMGTGVKWEIHSRLNLRLELNYRKLFTDYLDDVSTDYIDPALFLKNLPREKAYLAASLSDRRINAGTEPLSREEIRGNSLHNDAYFSLSLRTSYVLGRKRQP